MAFCDWKPEQQRAFVRVVNLMVRLKRDLKAKGESHGNQSI